MSGNPYQSELERLREENRRLRLAILRTRRSRWPSASILLLAIGVPIIVFGTITNSTPIVASAFIFIAIGLLTLYTTGVRYTKESTAAKALLSPLITLEKFCDELRAHGSAFYLPPLDGLETGRVFIPFDGGRPVRLPEPQEILVDRIIIDGKGLSLIPLGAMMFKDIEGSFGFPLRGAPLERVLSRLAEILTDHLELVDRFEYRIISEDLVEVRLHGSRFSYICEQGRLGRTMICEVFGCPVCSLIGVVIAKAREAPVKSIMHTYDPVRDLITLRYKILPVRYVLPEGYSLSTGKTEA